MKKTFIVLLSFVFTTIGGCSEKIEGTYHWSPNHPIKEINAITEQKIIFKGNKATVWMGGVGQECTYEKKGNVILIKHPQGQIIKFTQQNNGSIQSPHAVYKRIK